jgi:hypothetical protein
MVYDDVTTSNSEYSGAGAWPLFGYCDVGIDLPTNELYINAAGFLGAAAYGHLGTPNNKCITRSKNPIFRGRFFQTSTGTGDWGYTFALSAVSGTEHINDYFGIFAGGGSSYYQARSVIGGSVQATKTFATACDTNWHTFFIETFGATGDVVCTIDGTDSVTLLNSEGLYTGDVAMAMTLRNSTGTDRGIRGNGWSISQKVF